MIRITKPVLPKLESFEKELKEILFTGKITSGKYVSRFEESVRKFLKVNNAIAVSNCSTGLMLLLSNLPEGSEVIMPAFTFSATYQAIEWNNLKAVLVDIDDSLNINPNLIEKKITRNTAAILAVHISGVPCQVNILEAIAKQYRLKLFFDSAHAFGAECHKQRIGCFGDAEVFSFGPTKILAIGEGGMITTNNDELAENLYLKRNHGHRMGSLDYETKGFNARMQEINGIIGLKLLNTIPESIFKRIQIAIAYSLLLPNWVEFQKITSDSLPSFKDFSVFVNPEIRDSIRKELEKNFIETKTYYNPPINLLKRFPFKKQRFPVAEIKSKSVISLPIYPGLTFKDIKKIAIIFEKYGKNY